MIDSPPPASAEAPNQSQLELSREEKFISYIFDNYIGRPNHPFHPIAVIKQLRSASGRRKAAILAAADLATATLSWDVLKVAQVDAALKSFGAATLSEVRDEHFATFSRILKRGKISSHDEFDIVRSEIDRRVTRGETPDEFLQAIADQYEGI